MMHTRLLLSHSLLIYIHASIFLHETFFTTSHDELWSEQFPKESHNLSNTDVWFTELIEQDLGLEGDTHNRFIYLHQHLVLFTFVVGSLFFQVNDVSH